MERQGSKNSFFVNSWLQKQYTFEYPEGELKKKTATQKKRYVSARLHYDSKLYLA